MKKYVSITWAKPMLSRKDREAMLALRESVGLCPGAGVIEEKSPCGWAMDFTGPELTADEQEVLGIRSID